MKINRNMELEAISIEISSKITRAGYREMRHSLYFRKNGGI